MRLQELTQQKRNIKKLEINSLFCSFYGNNIFSIFFNDVKVLQEIVDWLDATEHPMQESIDDTDVPHSNLRKILYTLTLHDDTK